MQYWKSLNQFNSGLTNAADEFPEPLPEDHASREFSRRDFFKWSGMGAAATLALRCNSRVVEKALPYLSATEGIVPGTSLYYATVCGGCSAGCGVLAKSRDGRPIKLEGNPDHPVNRGGLCATGQAQTRGLYDGDRLRGPQLNGKNISWDDLDKDLDGRFAALKSGDGAMAVLTGTLISPSLRRALAKFLSGFKNGRHVMYDALSCAAIPLAYEKTHGAKLLPRYLIGEADFIVGIEADFLGAWIDPAGFTRAYTARRVPLHDRPMARHLQVEAGFSITGSNADERIRIAPSETAGFLERLHGEVAKLAGLSPAAPRWLPAPPLLAKIEKLADELWSHRGASLVLCGSNELRAQLLTARINRLLGNEGHTLDLARPDLRRQGDDGALAGLMTEMHAGRVAGLIVLEANPGYDLPAEFAFAEAAKKVPLRINLGGHPDETAGLCSHLAPDSHFLERWHDAEPQPGLLSLAQPLLLPLFLTRDAQESFLRWAGEPKTSLEYLRDEWKREVFPKQTAQPDFDLFWSGALQKGFVQLADTAAAPSYQEDSAASLNDEPARIPAADGFELLLYPSVALRDGRHANNPWLQELPDPVTKVTWDNYLQLSPASAKALGFVQGDVARILPEGEKTELELPVFIQPGLHDRTAAIALGYGRRGGKVAEGVGRNAFPWLRLEGGAVRAGGRPVKLASALRRVKLACTQEHHDIEGKDVLREMTLADFLKNPEAARAPEGEERSLYATHKYPEHQWAMAVDLNKCTGCSACVIGCQAENNIPVVGRDEVSRQREMHWLRLDTYYTGDPAEPDVLHQPMLCQQCGNAPCENVCPVLATVHSHEGLNLQIYNRCVGTRYCANNCPYKVRRFNWWEYPMQDEVARLGLNPDVTVRSRGVMEKCTFCIQRIEGVKNGARNEGRPLQDGEMKTACQQSCPGDAILFGDLHDPESRVSRIQKDPRRYRVLSELGVEPAVSYLIGIRNR